MTNSRQTTHLTTQHVLIVDDEPDVRLVMRRFLESLGLTKIAEATNGEEAIAYAAEHQDLSLVLLDLKMPKVDGVKALAKLRKAIPHAKFVVLTGYPQFTGVEAVFRDHSAAFLIKPIDLNELESLLNLFLK